MQIQRFFQLAKKSVGAWSDDYAPSMGAAIAYYTVFSLAPLLLIVIAVAGAAFGRDAVQGEIVAQLSGLLGHDGALAVQGLIKSASQHADGLLATAISIAVLLVGATTVFSELQSSLDRIWRVPAAAKSGLWATVRVRLLSFGLILGLAFLLIVSLVVSAGLAAFGRWAGGLMPGWEVTLQALNLGVSLVITTVLFAMIYKFMPRARIAWRDVWTGAVVTAVLFELGKIGIGLYVGKTSVVSSYAAAGSIIVLLVWVYYSAQIFLLGAEFTWVYANERGSYSQGPDPTRVAAPETPRQSRDPAAALPLAMAQAAHSQEEGGGVPAPTLKQKLLVYGALAVLQIGIRAGMSYARARRRRG
ncbi:MAG: YihY/virulence factor BrkB family protein [Pseudomonadota bacterium]